MYLGYVILKPKRLNKLVSNSSAHNNANLSTPGQQAETRGWEYNWIGEFGEKDNFRWDKVNDTGPCRL